MSLILDVAGFSIVILALVVVGLKKSTRLNEYLLADRSVGLFALVATLVMSEFNTSTLLAFSAFGYRVGPMALALPLVFLIGLGWYSLAVAKEWKTFNRLSVAELFTQKYGPKLGRTASVLLLLAMLGFSSTYIKSLALIFSPFVPSLSFWFLSAVLTGTVILMTVNGGLRSVVRTDILSFIFKIIFLPLLLYFAAAKWGGFSALAKVFPPEQMSVAPIAQWNHPELPFWFVSSLIVLTMFTYICSPWYGQKIFAARTPKIAFWAVAIASLTIFLLYGVVILAAGFYRFENAALANAEMVVPQMFMVWFPPFIRGLGFAVLFTAASTVLAGVWSAMVAMIVADFNFASMKTVSLQKYLNPVLIAVLCWLGANLLIDDILNRLILANIPIAALAFALLAAFHWKSVTTTGAWASVIVGFLWGAGCFIWIGEKGGYTWYWAIWGIPLIFAVGIVVSLVTAERTKSENIG